MLYSHSLETNTWSAPCAIRLTGISYGCMGGFAQKDVLVFIMDADTMAALSCNVALNLGGQASLTLGTIGRHVDTTWHASRGGVGATVAFSYTRGCMAGISLEGSVVSMRQECNADFYNCDNITTTRVLNKMPPPACAQTLYTKLETLAACPPPPLKQQAVSVMVMPTSYQAPSLDWHYVVTSVETPTNHGQEQYDMVVEEHKEEEEESEDDSTVAEMEPPMLEIIKTTTTQTTMTEPEYITCQEAYTQTGDDVGMMENDMEPLVFVTTKSPMQDCMGGLVQVESQTQTNDIVLVQVAATQTGQHDNDDYGNDETTMEKEKEPVMQQKEPLSLTAMLQEAQTQTDDHVDNVAAKEDEEDFVFAEMEYSDDEEDLEMVSSREEIQWEMMNHDESL